MSDFVWEGAELSYYFNGDSYSLPLSDTQFAIISRILGLKTGPEGTVTCYSDKALQQLITMRSNPLHLQEKKNE